ncbi:MAG: biotin--[acetyl-CoA-carboxylase] ligase [Thiomonas sp.]
MPTPDASPRDLPAGGEGWGGGADPLAPLRAQLAHTHPACAVRWVERTGSTNADLLAAARFGQLDSPTLLATRQQTAGRGRQGRVWLDDAQTSVLCSVAWPFAPQHDIRALSLAVGVWLTQALHALGASSVRLKWPNDLLLPVQGNWRKLGGVLVEMADTATTRWVVIGFGLNLRSPPGQTQATGLDAAGLTLDRGAVLAALAPALLDGLQGGLRQRDAALTQWDALHAWAGLEVSVQDRGLTLYSGTALGLAPDGALRVRTANGERRVLSADVSLRLAAAIAADAAK